MAENMSFSRKVKTELVTQCSAARHCQLAEFAALFMVDGHIQQDAKGHFFLQIKTENLTVARKSFILVRKIYHVIAQVMVRNHRSQKKIREYGVFVFDEKVMITILKSIKWMDDQGVLHAGMMLCHPMLIQNTCCKRAFLRGSFLTSGSVTSPDKAYHLEIAVLSEKYAMQLKQMMVSFLLDAKIVQRKKYYVVYLKEGTQIVDFLNVIGAYVALMDFENVRIVKEVRNSVNRQVNCETANITKIVNTGTRQVEDIQYIARNLGLHHLSDSLREMANLRLEHPDESLQELGQRLSPSIGKSGVNHRLHKLEQIAASLREKS